MPRKPTGPRYFPSKHGYYCEIRGVRHCLAKGDRDDDAVIGAAERRYHELMLTSGEPSAVASMTVGELLERYVAASSREKKPSTVEMIRYVVDRFAAGPCSTVKATELRPFMVLDWLDTMMKDRLPLWPRRRATRWGPGTRFIAITVLKAAFNWAVEVELIDRNPIARLRKPPKRSRGGDQLLDEAKHKSLLAAAKPPLQDFITALYETGARPGEVSRVTAADYHPEIGAWVLVGHKTERHGERRVIYLTPVMVALTERLAAERNDGPLFRNRCGRPWNRQTLIHIFWQLRQRLFGPASRVTPYSYRHLFATQFLLKGGSIATLAELLGNSVEMVDRHYGHLREHGKELRERLIDFRAPGP
jgi:integrase